jgi:hypothetical protein
VARCSCGRAYDVSYLLNNICLCIRRYLNKNNNFELIQRGAVWPLREAGRFLRWHGYF